MSAQATRKWLPLLRTLAPYAVGIAIIVLLFRRVPYAAVRDAMSHGPHLPLALFLFAQAWVSWLCDSIATQGLFRSIQLRLPLSEIAVVRGATYLLSLISYGLGQGGIGFYLHKKGISAARATGIVLYMMGVNLAVLTILAGVGALVIGSDRTGAAIEWTLIVASAGLVIELVVVALKPKFLSARALLSPLFEAGLRGHAQAALARTPHMIWYVFAQWLALRIWGVDVPLEQGLLLMPAVGLVGALPISPSGLGTTQAALVFFFGRYADGATPDEQKAHILAFAIVLYLYSAISIVVIGALCLRRNNAQLKAAETAKAGDPDADHSAAP